MNRPLAGRGVRRIVIVDLLLGVAIISLMFAGLRVAIESDLNASERFAATLALLGMPAVATLYGLSAAIEMRRGWLGTSTLTAMTHAGLVVGSLVGLGVLAIVSPAAAGLAIAAEAALLLWSSSWL